MVVREQPHPRQEPRRRFPTAPSPSPDGSRPFAIRRRCSSSSCATSRAPCSWSTPRRESSTPRGSASAPPRRSPYRDDLGAHPRHLRHASRASSSTTSASSSAGSRSRSTRSTSSPRHLETPIAADSQPRQAHGLALPRPAPPQAEPHLPHPDHLPARAARRVGREGPHRDPDPEAHGVGVRVARRALLGRLLRRHGVPRPEPPVLQADGAGRRLRRHLRGGPRVPRRPLVHLAGTRPSSPRSTPRSAGSTRTKTSWRCTKSCSSRASPPSKQKHGAEIAELLRHRARGAHDAVPAHPARRGEADRRRPRLRHARAPTPTWTPRASARSRRT